MAKFRTVKQALKKGYRIFAIDYRLVTQEFSIYMWNHDESVYFYCKKLPAYLKKSDFEKIKMETEMCAYFDIELSITKFNE